MNLRSRINDDDLIDAIKQAADQHGSKSEAVRHALRETYLNGSNDNPERQNSHLPDELQDAHERLWEETGEYPILRISRSISILAQYLGVDADTVKRDYLKQLERANMISLIEGMKLVVKDPIPAELTEYVVKDYFTNRMDPDERMDQLKTAEPVRADGGDLDNKEDTA